MNDLYTDNKVDVHFCSVNITILVFNHKSSSYF